MKDCIFCKIVNKSQNAYIIYEDNNYMAFLDVFPRVIGHVLLIPKKHYEWVDDVDNFGEYFEIAKKIGTASKKALNAQWVSYFTIGVDINHAHIHILPRKKNDNQTDVVNFDKILKLEKSKMQEIAQKYSQEIGGV